MNSIKLNVNLINIIRLYLLPNKNKVFNIEELKNKTSKLKLK